MLTASNGAKRQSIPNANWIAVARKERDGVTDPGVRACGRSRIGTIQGFLSRLNGLVSIEAIRKRIGGTVNTWRDASRSIRRMLWVGSDAGLKRYRLDVARAHGAVYPKRSFTMGSTTCPSNVGSTRLV
jgi:hypothetical protein